MASPASPTDKKEEEAEDAHPITAIKHHRCVTRNHHRYYVQRGADSTFEWETLDSVLGVDPDYPMAIYVEDEVIERYHQYVLAWAKQSSMSEFNPIFDVAGILEEKDGGYVKVKWLDWPAVYDSWIHISALSDGAAQQMLRDFRQRLHDDHWLATVREVYESQTGASDRIAAEQILKNTICAADGIEAWERGRPYDPASYIADPGLPYDYLRSLSDPMQPDEEATTSDSEHQEEERDAEQKDIQIEQSDAEQKDMQIDEPLEHEPEHKDMQIEQRDAEHKDMQNDEPHEHEPEQKDMQIEQEHDQDLTVTDRVEHIPRRGSRKRVKAVKWSASNQK